jgi:hypothetical protein
MDMPSRSNGIPDRTKPWRHGRTWLLAAAFVVMPFASVFLVMYGVGRLVLKRRPKTVFDPYQEWLTLRDLMRSQRQHADRVESADPLRRP